MNFRYTSHYQTLEYQPSPNETLCVFCNKPIRTFSSEEHATNSLQPSSYLIPINEQWVYCCSSECITGSKKAYNYFRMRTTERVSQCIICSQEIVNDHFSFERGVSIYYACSPTCLHKLKKLYSRYFQTVIS